jgi:hypothetical protein
MAEQRAKLDERALRPWLRDHVQGLDRALATHLQARAVGEPKA